MRVLGFLLVCLLLALLLSACQAGSLSALLGEDEDPDKPKSTGNPWYDLLGYDPEKAAKEAEEGDGPVAPSFDPIVLGGAPRTRDPDDLDRDRRLLPPGESGFREKWALAGRYHENGYDVAAVQIIDAALEQDPPEVWADRLRALRRTIEVRRIELEVLRVDVRPLRDYIVFGRGVDLEVRIRNVGEEPILLTPADAEGLSRGAVHLELERQDHDIFASSLRRAWTQVLPLQDGEGAVAIPPGGMHRQRARIPAEETGEAIQGFRVIRVGGVLRVPGARVGTRPRPLRVPVRAARIAVLPRGYEPLAEDPLDTLKRAVPAEAPAHLLVAAEFVPYDERAKALRLLAEALMEGTSSVQRAAIAAIHVLRERSVGEPLAPLASPLVDRLEGPAASAVMEGLRALSGEGLPLDARLWQEWWRRAKADRVEVRGSTLQPVR